MYVWLVGKKYENLVYVRMEDKLGVWIVWWHCMCLLEWDDCLH